MPVTRKPAETMTWKVRAALSGGVPLSVTRIEIELVDGPWAGAGVQVKAPLVALMTAPVGAPASRLKASVWLGRSGSVALTVKASGRPGKSSASAMGPSTG